jgi:hypothetical protein
MAHFARVNALTMKVDRVIVAEPEFIQTLPDYDFWIQTSYNTYGGQHPEGRPLRKNYAGIGYRYDKNRDAFIPPQPYASWALNESTCLWEAPVAYPDDGKRYDWSEESLRWEEVGIENGTD